MSASATAAIVTTTTPAVPTTAGNNPPTRRNRARFSLAKARDDPRNDEVPPDCALISSAADFSLARNFSCSSKFSSMTLISLYCRNSRETKCSGTRDGLPRLFVRMLPFTSVRSENRFPPVQDRIGRFLSAVFFRRLPFGRLSERTRFSYAFIIKHILCFFKMFFSFCIKDLTIFVHIRRPFRPFPAASALFALPPCAARCARARGGFLTPRVLTNGAFWDILCP